LHGAHGERLPARINRATPKHQPAAMHKSESARK
jgi:hypothetical protein